MKKLLTSLALTAVASTSAFAAVSLDPIGQGDIILGFYAAAEDKGLVINLGAFQAFDNRDGVSFTIGRLNVADIANVYGASWNSRTDITWAVTGAVNGTGELDGLSRNTVFATSPRALLASTPTSIVGNNSATQGTNDRTQIQGISQGYNTFDTTVVNGYAVIQNAVSSPTNTVAFRDWQVTTPTQLFGTFNDNDTSGTNISDFYGLVPTDRVIGAGNALNSGWTSGTNYLGSFTLDASGLSFTAAGASAIPEPSTYAALAGAAVLGLAAFRRRSVRA